MRPTAFLFAALIAVGVTAPATGGGQAAPAAPAAPPEGPRIVVTYVEAASTSDQQASALLRSYRDATRRDAGNAGAAVFQQQARPGLFMVVEEWSDLTAWKAHRGLAHVAQFHDRLTPLLVAPYDERTHTGIAVAPAQPLPPGGLLVVTHIDVTGAGAPKVREMLRTLAEASRREPGNVRFDALQGVRQNHFTMVEAWRDERARDAHALAAHTKSFREGLYQFAVDGAPYDERLYRPL